MHSKFSYILLIVLFLLLFIKCAEPTSSSERDLTGGLPANDLNVLKDILETNGLENSVTNRNQIASRTEICSNDTVIYRLYRLRLHDKIFVIPPSVSVLDDLEYIEITKTDNKLPLPKGLIYFKPLKNIIIYGRTIDSSFNQILSDLTPQHLVIDDSRILDIPTHIFKDTALDLLSLRNDSLSVISPEIGQLVNLESLFLEKNQLQGFPESISNLRKLRWINISYNSFVSFPLVLTRLDSLAVLDIAFNNISQLPSEITKLTNLIPGEIHFDGEVSFTRKDYNLKISSNKICNVSSEIDSFLYKFAGDYWKETQVCKE